MITRLKTFIVKECSNWTKAEIIYLVASLAIITTLSVNKDSIIAIIAALTGCLAAIFTGKAKLGAFFFGFINSILYAYISYKYQYYGEVMVKLFVFIPLNIIGFFSWKRHFDNYYNETTKRRLPLKAAILLLIFTTIVTVIYGFILRELDGALPFVDGVTTILATVALVLCVKRFCEHWILWIITNCINIYLWVAPFLAGTGKPIAVLLMWIFYLINSIVMYVRWLRLVKNMQENPQLKEETK